VYRREVGGETLTFGVSGKLMLNNLVMFDDQSRSYWSRAFSEAVEGPMKGTRLELVPSQLMDWRLWRELHPDTLVLDKDGGYRSDIYASYYRNRSAGIIGRKVSDDRLQLKEFVVGLEIGGAKKAYPYRELSLTPIVNDTVGGRDVVVTFDAGSAAGAVWDRTVDGQTLTFQPVQDGSETVVMRDDETGTLWQALTGRALEGPLTGSQLEQVATTPAFWFAWIDLFPDTDVYRPSLVE
jgi:hypothetical protein